MDDGNPLGRVDIALHDNKTALVSWLEQVEETAEIRVALVATDGKIEGSHTASKTDPSRQSGFPILKKMKKDYLIAYTKVDSLNTVQTLTFSLTSND